MLEKTHTCYQLSDILILLVCVRCDIIQKQFSKIVSCRFWMTLEGDHVDIIIILRLKRLR